MLYAKRNLNPWLGLAAMAKDLKAFESVALIPCCFVPSNLMRIVPRDKGKTEAHVVRFLTWVRWLMQIFVARCLCSRPPRRTFSLQAASRLPSSLEPRAFSWDPKRHQAQKQEQQDQAGSQIQAHKHPHGCCKHQVQRKHKQQTQQPSTKLQETTSTRQPAKQKPKQPNTKATQIQTAVCAGTHASSPYLQSNTITKSKLKNTKGPVFV